MATVEQVAKAALQSIIVQGSESVLEADEYEDFIFRLNNFMSDLEVRGVKLGYTVVNNIADTVTVPPGALRGIISNIAVELAPDYGGVVSPELVAIANSGMKTLRLIGVTVQRARFPSTLPRGSGSEPYGYTHISPFYPDLQAAIVSDDLPAGLVYMSTGASTTISVVNAPVLLSGTFTTSVANLFTATAAGRLTYTGELEARIPVTADVAATSGTDIYAIMIAKNGVPVLGTSSPGTTSATTTAIVELAKDDYIEIYIANRTDTSSIAATAATLRAG